MNMRAEDRCEIEQLLYRYCEILDRGDRRRLADLIFTQDAVEDHGVGLPTSHGRKEIQKFFDDLFREFAGTMHCVFNIQIDFHDNDRAIGTAYFQAFHWLQTADSSAAHAADFVTTGIYLDVYSRTASGWRISARRRRNVGPSPLAAGILPGTLTGLGGAQEE